MCVFCVAVRACDVQGGIYMLLLMDTYSATYAMLVIAVFECIAVAWVYGMSTLYTLTKSHTFNKLWQRPPQYGPAPAS